MPAKTPDTGVQRFEFRTGINGIPILGGMFRSGDPATIPDHKQHMAVNVRITPSGMISRPGLALEYDTGVVECIDGLTEIDDAKTQQLMLWPGGAWGTVDPSSPAYPATLSAASVRLISTGFADGYSELEFFLWGDPGSFHPIGLRWDNSVDTTMVPASNPFVHGGKIMQFVNVDRDVSGTTVRAMALVAMEIPQRSEVLGIDCYRQVVADPVNCPLQLGAAWPWSHPYGQAKVISWVPDLAGWKSTHGLDTDLWLIEDQISIPERADDLLSGETGVHEMLYVLICCDVGAGAFEHRLLKFDNVTWSTEYAPPDGLAWGDYLVGKQTYGPYLVGKSTAYMAYRGAAGTWTTSTWASIDCSGGGGHKYLTFVNYAALSYGGLPFVLGIWQYDGAHGYDHILYLVPNPTTYNINVCTAGILSTLNFWDEDGTYALYGAVIYRHFLYVLIAQAGSPYAASLLRFNLLTGDAPTEYQTYLEPTGAYPIVTNPWIQLVSGRVYIGGYCNDPGLGEVCHRVSDVTDPAAFETVYQLKVSDAAISGETLVYAGSFSAGCLPSIVTDDDVSEGLSVGLGGS